MNMVATIVATIVEPAEPVLTTGEPEPLPALVITADAFERFNKFNPAARDAVREFEASKFAWDRIRELTDDEQARQDTFDGETKLDTLIRRFVSEIIDLQTVAPGIDAKIAELKARKESAEKGIEIRKSIIQESMMMANWIGKEKSLKLDLATINTRPATVQVDYVDETKIPAVWYKRPDPVLDKAALKAKVLARYKALQAAIALKDDNERGAALAAVETDFGPEIPGTAIKSEGYTTTITFK